MAIQFTGSGILPPFVGSPVDKASCAPYKTTVVDFVTAFGTTTKRRRMLRNFIAYRSVLRGLGISDGFEWIGGSFVEDKDPADIDVVTFFRMPTGWSVETKKQVLGSHPELMGTEAKKKYECDPYFVELTDMTAGKVKQITYWYGLLSHQRVPFEWKGILELALPDADETATLDAMMQRAEAHA